MSGMSFGGPRWAVDHLAEHATVDELGAKPGCPDCVRAWLAVRPNDTGPVVPDAYPFVERRPGARCFLWMHPKAVVRWLPRLRIERYECACGKWYWLSAPNGLGRPTRFRNR